MRAPWPRTALGLGGSIARSRPPPARATHVYSDRVNRVGERIKTAASTGVPVPVEGAQVALTVLPNDLRVLGLGKILDIMKFVVIEDASPNAALFPGRIVLSSGLVQLAQNDDIDEARGSVDRAPGSFFTGPGPGGPRLARGQAYAGARPVRRYQYVYLRAPVAAVHACHKLIRSITNSFMNMHACVCAHVYMICVQLALVLAGSRGGPRARPAGTQPRASRPASGLRLSCCSSFWHCRSIC